jgi:hypothetical protein
MADVLPQCAFAETSDRAWAREIAMHAVHVSSPDSQDDRRRLTCGTPEPPKVEMRRGKLCLISTAKSGHRVAMRHSPGWGIVTPMLHEA